jgi:tetratricopeptide (TPR) repeat protein
MNGSPDSAQSSAELAKVGRPDTEELVRRLDQWILWVREHVETEGDIPSVRDLVANAAKSNGKDLLFAAVPDRVSSQALESCWGNRLADSPVDLGVRAGVLCCAFWNLHKMQAELDDFEDIYDPIDEAEEVGIRHGIKDACARLEKTLALLVRFLPVEDCAGTWRHLRWEVLNSYLIHDWERAARFYNRAEELGLCKPNEIAVLRGQFRFLVVFGDSIEKDVRRFLKNDKIRLSLDSLFWNPAIFRSGASEPRSGVPGDWMYADDFDQLKAQLLFENGMCDEDRGLALKDSDRALLLDAGNDLQKAFLAPAALPYPYRAVLGRCHYCTGHFHDAAEQYSALLQTQGQLGQPKAHRKLFASLSLSYRQAGETERAKEILEQWAREFPGEKGIYLQLAELEARSANYHRIDECLRKEIERNPAVEEDWKLSALLALATTRDSSRALDALKDTPLWRPVYTTLQEHWKPFRKLGETTREQWVSGLVLNHLPDLPEKTRLRMAAESCARAVEIELRDRVFRRFKEHVVEHASVKTKAENGLGYQPSSRLCQFLVRDGDMTLGEMVKILKICRRDEEPILRDLQNWISRMQGQLTRNLADVERVVAFRNRAIHENRIESNPADIMLSCRTIIEALN